MDTTRTYTSLEVCRAAGITYRQLDYLVRTGKLPTQPVEVGSGSFRRFTESELDRVIEIADARRRARALLDSVGV